MKKHGIGSRLLALLLALALVLPMMPMQASAAKGDISNDAVSTGLDGNIDIGDTISLPIKIYDYENDGMMFEFAESSTNKTAANFGSSHYVDMDATADVGNAWSDVTVTLPSNDYKTWTKLTWAGNTSGNWVGGNAGIYVTPTMGTVTDMDDVRYLTLVYRSNVASDSIYFGVNRTTSAGSGAGDTGNYTGAMTFKNTGDDGLGSTTNWTYAVYDLKTGSLKTYWDYSINSAPSGLYIGLPIDASGEYIELAYVAMFDNKAEATAFGEYALTDGSNRGDNRGFGLLRSSRNQSGDAYAGVVDKTDTVVQLNTYGSSATVVDFSTLTTLGYTLLGEFGLAGIANVGLLESGLSEEGYPVYKEEVIDYIAGLLEHSLTTTERTSDGWKNYRYVKGTASDIYGGTDLATALRSKITSTGSYAASSRKDLVGTWAEVGGNITTYYDAAYFLLNSIFVAGSYNEVQDDYNYMILSAATDTKSKDKVYVFDGGFASDAAGTSAVKYDTDNHTIQNSDASYKPQYSYSYNDDADLDFWTTLNPFLPVTDDNNVTGQTMTTYYQDDGVIQRVQEQAAGDTLYQRDFNFAMVSEGEFVYHADDELFFEFEGDDDVYLFINNELVMDIGSAHSIDSVRFELNDYVNAAKAGTLGSDARNKALALEEGNTYSFKFYYMERHSYGSNIRICTNIRVTDPGMVTAKTAWQSGTQLDFGSIVDKDKVVEYGFAITNNGGENLYNLTFTDNDIGVTLDPTNGLTVKSGYNGVRVFNVNGGTLEATDLTAVVSHPDYNDITVTFADNEALKAFLASLTSDAVVENGGGLWIGSTVLIRGIGYKLSDAQVTAGVFDNTVFTSSTNKTKSKTLYGQATMRVFVPADPMYYEWAGHDLSITKDKLITDVLAAANQKDNILNGKVSNLTASNVNKIELVTKAGTAITSPYVTIDSSNNLTINYTTAGSKVFYVKVTYNSSKNTVIVPVLVNVTNVQDSVFVLDYGLEAVLTGNNKSNINELLKNDTLTVPGRNTEYSFLGLGTNGAYSPNEIAFTNQGNEVVSGSGTYTLNDKTLTYLPTDFMDTADVIQLAVNVYESDITPSNITGTLDINNEVEMYKNVTVLPATVVYYEDDFPAITYIESTNTFEQIGTGSSGNSQGVDQDENYGHDDSYANDDEMSGDSLTTITINQSGPVAQFTFKGTGFELIGRTNAYDSATIELAVFEDKVDTVSYDSSTGLYTGSNNETPVRMIPVITEFDNGDNGGTEEIYQVPVIRVDDLELNTYTVVIGGVPAYDWEKSVWPDNMVAIPTNLYIDGLRIYQPMGATNDNYSDDENGATFTEIRDLIVNGQAAVAEWDGENLTVSTGTTTWTENLKGVDSEGSVYEGNVVDSVNDYLLMGPNNEVYMDGSFTDAALAFQVTENGTGAHSLQVAIHGVDQGLFYGSGTTGMHAPVYYATASNTWEQVAVVTSGTEQYYTIDYTKCPVANGAYQVYLKVDADEDNGNITAMASYTSLKTVGLEISNINGTGEAATLEFVNGVLVDKTTGAEVDPASYPAFELLGKMLSTSVMAAPEQPVLPEPDEPAYPFADVEEGAFYIDAMLWAVDNGITKGTSETTFSPNKLVSRAEAVTFLWRAAGEPEPLIAENPFVDVSENDFYYKAVLWAVENGITNGLDATHFGPLTTCNRAQVVTFLYRTAGEPEVETAENPFVDVTEQDFYYDAVLWAIESGITNGIDAVSFGPNADCNRAQIVTFLYRAQ